MAKVKFTASEQKAIWKIVKKAIKKRKQKKQDRRIATRAGMYDP
jgi:hypothetical protein